MTTRQALAYVEMDVPRCARTYGVPLCKAQLGYADGTSPVSARFDGDNDYLRRVAGLTGAADGKQGTISFLIAKQGADGAVERILTGLDALAGAALAFTVAKTANGRILFFGENAAGSTILSIQTSVNQVLVENGVRHVIASWDLSDTAKRHIYVDDVSDLNVTTFTNDTLDYTLADWAVGALGDGTQKFEGDLAELWFSPTYIDLSIAANRQKFYANGRPVFLGDNGELPTGSAPLIFLSGTTWHTNKGTGGGFTQTGTIEEGEIATGSRKCFNTPNTCQDRDGYLDDPLTLRFAKNNDYLPADIGAIPSVLAIEMSPGEVSLGRSLGHRASLTVTFRDHRHSDTGGFDPYVAERDYDPFARGTFWGKFRARSPFLRGRPLRVVRGFVGENLADMETRHYVIDSFDGPSPDGTYRIVAKDPLKLADNDRAQAPRISNGFLVAGITNSAASATLSPAGIGDAEYPASGWVAIGGKEICAFTRSGDALTLTRAQFNTTAQAHNAQDRVQLCLRYNGEDPGDIIRDLLVNYADFDDSWIPIAIWNDETAAYLGRVYTTLLAEPVGVKTLIDELIEQAALSIWWDDAQQQLQLRVLRAIATDADTFDESRYLRGSLTVREQPDLRLSQVWTYFAQINPLKKIDDRDNFRSTAATVDLQAESDYGSPAIKVILSRWIPEGGRSAAEALNDKQLARYRDPPRRVGFRAMRGAGTDPLLGTGYQLAGWTFQDDTGAAVDVPIQLTSLVPDAATFSVEAEEMLFAGEQEDLTERSIIIDSNTRNVNMRTLHDALYPAPTGTENPAITVTCIVQAGVIVGSNSAGLFAFDTGSWPSGVSLVLEVRGTIEGMGGNGGLGGSADGTAPFRNGDAGGGGGTALKVRAAIHVQNDGVIAGGGGGGGGAAAASDGAGGIRGGGGGGGGGAGDAGGPGGAGRSGTNQGSTGQNGTLTAGGTGGSASVPSPINGQGGNGGGRGSAGAAGQSSPDIGATGGAGGAAGTAIDGVSLVTLTGSGSTFGPTIN